MLCGRFVFTADPIHCGVKHGREAHLNLLIFTFHTCDVKFSKYLNVCLLAFLPYLAILILDFISWAVICLFVQWSVGDWLISWFCSELVAFWHVCFLVMTVHTVFSALNTTWQIVIKFNPFTSDEELSIN